MASVPQTTFADEIASRLADMGQASSELGTEARQRLNSMAALCSVYRNTMMRYPQLWLWLEKAENLRQTFGYSALRQIWEEEYDAANTGERWLRELQRFRRQISLRIAYRELGGVASIRDSLKELSLLADFCMAEVLSQTMRKHEARWGVPWNEELNRQARFCVLGLGKLGGQELNFCSDVDLIFFFDGRGSCRKAERVTAITNDEFFARVAREFSQLLQENSEEGFLYNVDLRLRPEGDSGPLVRSLASMENYYSVAGQTWERLALVKARVVAGSEALGAELFESLTSFRYPRRPPPGLFSEIAGVKLRIEREVLRDNLDMHLKTGPGGIREIEFFVQALQMVHAGRNPFLQTTSTLQALDRLHRYQQVTDADYAFLLETYLFFRELEHRLQMREEKQTHTLPAAEDTAEWQLLAESMNFENGQKLRGYLDDKRAKVRKLYQEIFGLSDREEELQEWTLFFSGKTPSPMVYQRLRKWFWGPLEPVEERLRKLLLGGANHLLTREHIVLFLEIARQFDQTFDLLAHPMNTLERVDRFAERYGARKEFLRMCAHQTNFFKAICLLFDRSTFIFELLCQRPEILEEIFVAGLRLAKASRTIVHEVDGLPRGSDEEMAKWLWLYVRAEQVRIAIAEVLSDAYGSVNAEIHLTGLADAVLAYVLRYLDPAGQLTLVALGKYGATETTFGSDLDLMLLASDEAALESATAIAKRFLRIAGHSGPQGKTFDLDLRLRPFGNDGPLVVTVQSLAKYHAESGRLWERQLLCRARVVDRAIAADTDAETENDKRMDIEAVSFVREMFEVFREKLLFTHPITNTDVEEILRMRQRVEAEKARIVPPERAFKSGPGGLQDVEFIAQTLQLRHGWEHPAIRISNTRTILRSAIDAGLLTPEDGQVLLENYERIRMLELFLRRIRNLGVSEISEDTDEHVCIAKWNGFPDYEAFWQDHTQRMAQNRALFLKIVKP